MTAREDRSVCEKNRICHAYPKLRYQALAAGFEDYIPHREPGILGSHCESEEGGTNLSPFSFECFSQTLEELGSEDFLSNETSVLPSYSTASPQEQLLGALELWVGSVFRSRAGP